MALTRSYVHDQHTMVDELGNEVVMFHRNTLMDVATSNKSNVTAVGKIMFSAVCGTDAAVSAKTVSAKEFAFVDGAHLSVKFTNGISVANATLNVNDTGPKAILLKGKALPAGVVLSNDQILLRYNGSSFEIVGGVNSTYVSRNNERKLYLVGVDNENLAGTPGNEYFNTSVYISADGNTLAAPFFSGDGSNITHINASNISSGTLNAARLATSGVKAGSYATAENASPAFGDSFNIPRITVDKYGRITSAKNVSVTLPSGGTLTEELIPDGGLAHVGKSGYIAYPEDGYFTYSSTDSITGGVIIRLPIDWISSMMKFTVSIYNYHTNQSVDYIISGHTWNNLWYKCSAVCVGNASEELSNLAVRFIIEQDKPIITIGESMTAWSYPVVKICNISVRYENDDAYNNYSKWCRGWNVSIGSIASYNAGVTITNTHVGYGSIASSCTGNSETATNASKLGGYTPSISPIVDSVVLRDAWKYTHLYYTEYTTPDSENPTISQVIVTNGSDGYLRKAAIGHLASSLGLKTSVLFTSSENTGIDTTNSTGIGYVTESSGTGLSSDGALYRQAYSDAWAHEIYGDYRTGQIAIRGKNSGTWQGWRTVIDSGNVANYNAGGAYLVRGTYTGNGGAQPPSYVPSGAVRFNMMDKFPGFSGSGYMDTILMDTYSGGDVPWVTGIGVVKAAGNPRMFIAVGSKGNSAGWSYMTEAITSGNIGSQSVNYATSSGNSSTLGGLSASYGQAANTIVARNEHGYIYAGYIHSDTGNYENPPVSQVIVTNGSDGFYRKASLAHLKAQMGLDAVNNTADANKSVNYAASAGNADTVDGHHFNWSGQSGQPTWLWGGNDSTNMYVYNPSNFSVNYATTANSATYAACDGAARNIVNTYLPFSGGTMTGNINMSSQNQAITWSFGSLFGCFQTKQFGFFPDGWSSTDALKSALYMGYTGSELVLTPRTGGSPWVLRGFRSLGANNNVYCPRVRPYDTGPEMHFASANVMNFHSRYWTTADPSTSKPCVTLWFGDSGVWLRPSGNNLGTLGSATEHWKELYCSNGSIITSDERKKLNMKSLDEDQTKAFIMGLNPISYIMVDGDSRRTHYGMGAQSVEQLMHNIGMTSKDFAGFIKSPRKRDVEIDKEIEVIKDIEVIDEDGSVHIEPQSVKEIQKLMTQEIIEGEYDYGLRYEEFISPLIKMVQMQQRQIESQEEKIERLTDMLNAIRA